MTRLIEGDLVASTAGITIVVARFNELIVDSLLNGALTTLKRQCVQDKHITVVKVPGAFEIPLAAQLSAEQSDCAAVITLGGVIRLINLRTYEQKFHRQYLKRVSPHRLLCQ